VEDGGKRMKRQLSLSLIGILIISLILSGCSDKKNTQGSDAKTTIKVATLYSEKDQGAAYKEIAKKFEESNPDIKIEVMTDYSDETKIKETLSQKGDIDIIGIKRNQVIEFARSGLIADLSQIVEENQLEKKLYRISQGYGKYNGKIYGIGDMPMVIEWFYNADMFSRYGLKEPTNIKELTSVCSKLKSNNITPISIGAMDEWTLSMFFGMITAQTTGNAELTSNYGSDAQAYKNIPGIKDAFKIYENLVNSCIPKSNADINYRQSIDDFVKGKAAILPAGSWATQIIDEIKPSGFQYKTFEQGVNFVENPVTKYSASAGQVIVLSSKSKNAKEAQKFISYLFSEEAQKIFVDKGYISSLSAANSDESTIKRQILSHIEQTDDNSVMIMDNLEPKMAENLARVLQDMLEGRVKASEAWDRVLKITFKQ
jgi:ABC-type glycerol-3-phosphate transport system substrate-binding protein